MQVYADNAATTKMSRTAIDAMLPYMDEIYGKGTLSRSEKVIEKIIKTL